MFPINKSKEPMHIKYSIIPPPCFYRGFVLVRGMGRVVSCQGFPPPSKFSLTIEQMTEHLISGVSPIRPYSTCFEGSPIDQLEWQFPAIYSVIRPGSPSSGSYRADCVFMSCHSILAYTLLGRGQCSSSLGPHIGQGSRRPLVSLPSTTASTISSRFPFPALFPPVIISLSLLPFRLLLQVLRDLLAIHRPSLLLLLRSLLHLLVPYCLQLLHQVSCLLLLATQQYRSLLEICRCAPCFLSNDLRFERKVRC